MQSIGSIGDLTQNNTASTEELASNLEELSAKAEELQSMIQFFKTNIEK